MQALKLKFIVSEDHFNGDPASSHLRANYKGQNVGIHVQCDQGCIQKIFPGGGKLGPHKRMTLAIMIFA